VYVPEDLSLEDISQLGFQVGAKRMDNGEYRIRLMRGTEHGSCGYIATIMPPEECGWQNSHYHEGVQETYAVQSGWIGYAILMPDETARFFVFTEGGVFTTQCGEIHNVYMPAGAFIHTLKHGDVSRAKDWVGSDALDALTKPVSEEELLRLAAR
jgi:hypothetical protein